MPFPDLGPEAQTALHETLGYLNYSAGAADPGFRARLNRVYGEFVTAGSTQPWLDLREAWLAALAAVAGTSEAFRQVDQAQAVVELAFDHLWPAYRQYHADLLFHQTDAELLQPFFVARLCEAVLKQGGPWDETERITSGALDTLNDYIGYRPVATLQTEQRIEPYDHEWVCPVPLYLRDAGVGVGPFAELVAQALEILRSTDADILEMAAFDLSRLDELAFDPRAYDFDHPVNKRPNYHFGLWDPHLVDNRGYYRRFVVQEVTLEGIQQRVDNTPGIAREELLLEAGAVLAGIILMASATSGWGPACHDSSVTLAGLLPRIARFRDLFYTRLLARVQEPHAARLKAEAQTLRQSFGGARQHLNHRLARLRATQLQHVHLAQLFARMGNLEASTRQAHVVPVASARMLCEISGQLTATSQCIDRQQPEEALQRLAQVEDLLNRGIHCGALVDPWNILGFQGQFSLSPALQDSVHDHRVDVLIHLISQIFAAYVRTVCEAAATGQVALADETNRRLIRLANWWDQFATSDVSGVQHVLGSEVIESGRCVSEALLAWHAAGESSGDLAFWRGHVDQFRTPKTYALVIGTLLSRGDLVAARALLALWLGQHDHITLDEDEFSFHHLALRWLNETWATTDSPDALPNNERWELTRKFLDYLEANAEEWWDVPRFEWHRAALRAMDEDELDSLFHGDMDDDEDDNPFQAAYDDVVYRDSTRDGIEGETLEGGAGEPTDVELELETDRISRRLHLLATIARLWRMAALLSRQVDDPSRNRTLAAWYEQSQSNQHRLLELLDAVHRHPLTPPRGTHDSLVDFDRRRHIKETLLGRIVATYVETREAGRTMLAAGGLERPAELSEWETLSVEALEAMYREDPVRLRELFPRLRSALDEQPVLYVPLAKGGDPRQIVAAQTVQQVLSQLLRGMPGLGLVAETCQLIATAQHMERHRPEGDGAVTEFDRLFETGYLAIVECLVDVDNAAAEHRGFAPGEDGFGAELIEALQQLTESLLKRWHHHSRNLRLSALEKVGDKKRWQAVVEFIQTYGHDLFNPRFLNLGNLRAILHQGVDQWLACLEEDGADAEYSFRLLEALDHEIPRDRAVELLTVVIEAVIENYAEFKDFNSTTTQSDRGELLYMLLDFLRLKVSYERFAWNIKPVVMAHEVLVRKGKTAAAELWRRAVAERTSEVADWHLARQAELSRQYGMRLPTVADLLEERFVRPLAIDLLRALVAPAIEDARQGREGTAFRLLEQELAEFTEKPTGAGLDVPAWLVALEQEAGMANQLEVSEDHLEFDLPRSRRPARLTWTAVFEQLRTWDAED